MEKYIQCFKNAFEMGDETVIKNLKYRDDGWDSVAHMVLMSELEDAFNITLETDDVIDFSSFQKGIEILKKYNVIL